MTNMRDVSAEARVERRSPDTAVVVCRRCGEPIGRVQTEPTRPDADQEQIEAEIRTIVDEHRALCGKAH